MILSSTESNHNFFFSYVSEKRKEYSFQNDIFSTIFALLNKSRERQQPGKCIGSNTEYIYHSGIFYENRSGAEIVHQVKVSRARNKTVEPQILPKNERTNLFS